MNTKILNYFIAVLALGLAFVGCTESSDPPPNPFENLPQETAPEYQDSLEDMGIAALHRDIFEVKCATPGCHDGSFEPDFRTVSSTYATLVYHPVIKNTQDGAFKYRVIPHDPENSWLHERLITGDEVLGRMPLYAPELSDEEMERIVGWINAGAPDMFGQSPSKPNLRPNFVFYFMTNEDYSVDYGRNRVNGVPYNPIILPNNASINFVPNITDDNTPLADLRINRLQFSLTPDNFSRPVLEATAQFYDFGEAGQFWIANYDSGDLPQGVPVYMRYTTQDDNESATTFPRNDSQEVYKMYWSVIVNP